MRETSQWTDACATESASECDRRISSARLTACALPVPVNFAPSLLSSTPFSICLPCVQRLHIAAAAAVLHLRPLRRVGGKWKAEMLLHFICAPRRGSAEAGKRKVMARGVIFHILPQMRRRACSVARTFRFLEVVCWSQSKLDGASWLFPLSAFRFPLK